MTASLLAPQIVWQADPRWADMLLGYSERTMKSDGCLFIAHLALYRLALKRDIMPDELDAEFKRLGKYEGPWRNYLRAWTSTKGTFNDVVRWRGTSAEAPPPMYANTLETLKHWLLSDLNNFAFIKLDINPAINGNQNHFVLAYGVDRMGEILCMDPAFAIRGDLRKGGGKVYYGAKRLLEQYGSEFAGDLGAIWRYDLLQIQPARVGKSLEGLSWSQ